MVPVAELNMVVRLDVINFINIPPGWFTRLTVLIKHDETILLTIFSARYVIKFNR